MAIVFRLVKGTQSLDLTTYPYAYDKAMLPPGLSTSYDMAGGTSANRMGGAALVGSKANTRQWSFGIRVHGANESEVRSNTQVLVSFLGQFNDENNPLYIEYRGNNSVSIEPLWGQFGTSLRYQVDNCTYNLTGITSMDTISSGLWVQCNFGIKPFALGNKQRLASAKGGVVWDKLGKADNQARGLGVWEATTNKVLNPVFGNATYDNGWTAAASIIKAQNTDSKYIYPSCVNSVKLISIAGANNTYTVSLNVGNNNGHCFTAWLMAENKAALTNSDVVIYYGGAQATTVYAIGNGIYMFTAYASGVAAGTNTGITISSGRTVYLMAYQVEEKTYPTPLACGDFMGNSWAGTAHDSTSTRAAGIVSLPIATDTVRTGNITVRVGLITGVGYTMADGILFDMRDGSNLNAPYGKYQAADDTFYISSNASGASSAAQTFTARTKLILHFVYNGMTGARTLYINGVSAATDNSYIPSTLGAKMFIGTDYRPAAPINGTLSIATYAGALTGPEVLADYTNALATMNADRAIEEIPFIWSLAADGAIYSAADATHHNYTIVGGVPGTMPARTQMDVGSTNTRASSERLDIFLANSTLPNYLSGLALFADLSGTAVGGTFGGQVKRTNLNTTATDVGGVVLSSLQSKELFDKPFIVLASMADAGANLVIAAYYFVANLQYFISDYLPMGANATYKTFATPELFIPSNNLAALDWLPSVSLTIGVEAKRTAAGAANLDVDFLSVLFGDVMFFHPTISDVNQTDFPIYYDSTLYVAFGAAATGYPVQEYIPIGGRLIEFSPGCYNLLCGYFGDRNLATMQQADHIVINRIVAIPRWSLL